MTDIAADERIRRDYQALAEAAAVVGSVQIRNRATLAGQHLQRLAGGRHVAGAARLRGTGRRWPARPESGPSRSTMSSSGRASRRSPAASSSRRSSCRARRVRIGSVHVRRTRRRGHDLASVTLACAVGRRRRDPARVRQPRPAAGPRRRRDRAARRPGRAGRARRCELLETLFVGASPSPTLDAGEPRVPAGDAPRPRPARRRRRDRPARGRGGGPAMTTRRPHRAAPSTAGRDRSTSLPHHTLLEVLRDDLGLTGTKECCLVGECGACTVLVDGRSVDSCLDARGRGGRRDVTTVEGLAAGDRLHPLQQAFLDTGAAQCGFCIPGQLVSAQALLALDPAPDPRRGRGGPRRQPLPLRRLRADHRGGAGSRGRRGPRDGDARRHRSANGRPSRTRTWRRSERRRVAGPRRRPRPRHRGAAVRRRPAPRRRPPRQARHARRGARADRPDRRDGRARGARRPPRDDRRRPARADAALRAAAPRPAGPRRRARRSTTASRSPRSPPRPSTPPRRPPRSSRSSTRSCPRSTRSRSALAAGRAARPGPVAPSRRPVRRDERPPRAPLRLGRRRRGGRARPTSSSRAPTRSRWSPSSRSSRTPSWPRPTATASRSGARSSTRTGCSGSSPTCSACRSRRSASSRPTRAARSAASSTPSTSRCSRSWPARRAGRSASC